MKKKFNDKTNGRLTSINVSVIRCIYVPLDLLILISFHTISLPFLQIESYCK